MARVIGLVGTLWLPSRNVADVAADVRTTVKAHTIAGIVSTCYITLSASSLLKPKD